MDFTYDFSGWATRNDVRCGDGRTIRRNAFKENDGQIVPLVWNHQHNTPDNVLGHALLENREEGVYAYCAFNDTFSGKNAKEMVQHGDITALSIYANRLKEKGGDVLHGAIREVSLVLAGANPGALIDSVLEHSENGDVSAIIYTDEEFELFHAEETETKPKEEKPVANESTGKTVGEVFDSLTEEQKTVVYALIGQALEDAQGGNANNTDSEGGNEEMKHNVFSDEPETNVLSHSEMEAIFSDGKRYGSLKEAVLQHGIEDIEMLFPDAQKLDNTPQWIQRENEWVSTVMKAVHNNPFSRIKSMFANITEDDARARGYFGGSTELDPDTGRPYRDDFGNMVNASGNRVYKKEEVFSLLKRTTTPTTIYKKQRLDRDDTIDITDFDVVAWLKSEMRVMLDEEIARAILVGDGRAASSDDKINETNIRPIWKDDDLFTIKTAITVDATADADTVAKAAIRAAVKSRKDYRGSGNPVFFTTEDTLTDMLLMEDSIGHVLYDSVDKLATAMRVSKIVTVPVMEGLTRVDTNSKTRTLIGIIVNLSDYTVGADKGGSINLFDDFDIDYNQQKYLIETRCSGALTKPYSAIALELIRNTASGT